MQSNFELLRTIRCHNTVTENLWSKLQTV